MNYTNDLPIIHYYNQDFIDVYNKAWVLIENSIKNGDDKNNFKEAYFGLENQENINQLESIFSTFFLVYSNKKTPLFQQLDNFYCKQREDGFIANEYKVSDGSAVILDNDIQSIGLPFFAWAEYNIYCKIADKRRLQAIAPKLIKYNRWIFNNMFDSEMNLIKSYKISSGDNYSVRDDKGYFVDFNSAFVIDLIYLIKILETINLKESILEFNKNFFLLKINMNYKMWDEEDGFYYDLDLKGEKKKIKCISNYSVLLAKIPDYPSKDRFLSYLKSKDHFNSQNPFPFISKDEEFFLEDKENSGAVYPFWTFIIVKGLEKNYNYKEVQNIAIRHLFSIINSCFKENFDIANDTFYYAYKSSCDSGIVLEKYPYKEEKYLYTIGLCAITMFIENIIGLNINLSKKILVWNVIEMEEMGVENLSLRRNNITIISLKQRDRWEIKLMSEKLYYIHINEIDKNKTKQLPILSGKCILILDKVTDIVLTKIDSYI